MKSGLRLLSACLLVYLMSPPPVQAGGYGGEDAFEIGEKLFAKKNYGTARRYYERALWRDPQRSEALQRIGEIEGLLKEKRTAPTTDLVERGKSLFKNRKYRQAEKVLLQALSKDKSRPEIHFLLGDVYLQLEEYGKAKSEYNQAKRYY